MKNDKKILVCLYIIIGFLLINTIILGTKDFGGNSNNNNPQSDPDGSNADYDVSKMNKVDLDNLLKLFETNDTKVVYMGRPDCGACIAFVPTLNQIQSDYGFTTVYLDINTVKDGSTEFTKFMNKLSKEYTMETNSGPVTKPFGEFYGYTPSIFIIKNKKMVDGDIGSLNYASLSEFLERNGITK